MIPEVKSLIRRVVLLAVVGLATAASYLSIPANWAHADAAILILRLAFITWALLAGVILLKLRTAFRATQGGTSSVVVAALRNGVFRTLWGIYRREAFPRIRLWILYVFWGIMITGVVIALSAAGRLDDTEAQILMEFAPMSAADSINASRILVLETGDNNPTDYLRDLAKIAGDLKSNGALAVVAKVPSIIVAKPSHMVLVDSIQRTGIAILYSGHGWPGNLVFPFYSGNDKEVFSRRTWYIEPFLADPRRRTGLVRWYPSDTASVPPAVDALVEAAARYVGSPETLSATVTPHALTYGMISVPLNDRRQATAFLPRPRTQRPGLNVHAYRELDSDTLWFYSSPEWKASRGFPAEFAGEVQGRIVFVAWIVPPTQMDVRELFYVNILGTLLRNEAVREYGSAHLYATCLVVLLSALLCLKSRPGMAAAIILSGGVALLLGSAVLLATHHILVQAAYPAAAAFLAGVVFPLVRLAHAHV